MPILEIADFSGGMDQRPTVGPRKRGSMAELRNLFPNGNGRLQRRRGHVSSEASIGSIVGSTFRASFRVGNTFDPLLDYFTLFVECAAAALTRRTAVSGSKVELKNYSYSPAASHTIYFQHQLFAPFLLYANRVFFGLGSTSNKHLSWADLTSLGLSTPEAYALGHAAPAAAPSLALVSGVGDLTDARHYGFKYTYYNSTHGDETIMSAGATQLTATPDLRIRVTMTQIVDQGYDQCRIYRTDPQATAQDATDAAHKLVGAVDMTNGTSTFTSDVDNTTIDTVAYTLGAQNATTDHDVLTELPIALETYVGRMWAAILPSTLRFCKRTTDAVYPEAWPVENSLLIGDTDTRITGLKTTPGQDGLLVFTDRSVFVVRGSGVGDFQVQRISDDIGCIYHRTIVGVGRAVYFLANDNQVWATDGVSMQRMSDPVAELLKPIRRDIPHLPVAGTHEARYWLSFSSHTPVTSSSTGTSIGSVSLTVMNQGKARTITDASAWDLSGVLPGMFAHVKSASGTHTPYLGSGFVVAVDDANDKLTIEQSSTSPTPGSTRYDVVTNDRVVVYDTVEGWWTQYRDMDIYAFDWLKVEQDDTSGGILSNFVGTGAEYDTYKMLERKENVDANSFWDARTGGDATYFTHYFLTNPFQFPDPVIVTGFYIYWRGDSVPSTTLTAFVDGETSASISKTFTPSESNRYRIGLFARCRQIEIAVSHTPSTDIAAEIDRIAIEYKPVRVRK